MTADNASRLGPACLSGTTIWEPARTAAYMAAGIRPPKIDVACNYFPDQTVWYGNDVPRFTDPQGSDGGSPAPWWDPHPQVAPLAAKCAGVIPIKVTGLDNDTTTVTVVQTVEGRGIASNRSVNPRTIELRVALVAQDCCSAAYLLQWFKRALASASECDSACYGADLTYLKSVPDPADCRSAAHTVGTAPIYQPATSGQFVLRDPAGGSAARDGDTLRAPAEITSGPVTLRDPLGATGARGGDVVRSPQPKAGTQPLPADTTATATLAADEHVRILTGVHSTAGVVVEQAVGNSCGSCGCGPVLIVTAQLTAGNPEPWRPELPIASGVAFDTSSPVCVADFITNTPITVTQKVQQSRTARPINVLRNGTWCLAGDYSWFELQQFGGTSYAEATFIDEADSSGSAEPCCDYPLRLYWDGFTTNAMRYETVGWSHNDYRFSPTPGWPCGTNCTFPVVEIVHPNPAYLPSNTDWQNVCVNSDPANTKYQPTDGRCVPTLRDQAPTSGAGCVYLQAYPDPFPTLEPGHTPNLAGTVIVTSHNGHRAVDLTETDVNAKPYFPSNGWDYKFELISPCPQTYTSLNCADVTVVNAPIVLHNDGTWTTDGTWAHIPFHEFPSKVRNYSIAGQVTTDMTVTVTSEVKSGNCAATACDAGVDLLSDPNCQVLAAPTPPPPPSSCGVCRPMLSYESVFQFTETRMWSNYAPIFEFYSGAKEARSVDFLIWANPYLLDPHDPRNRQFFLDCNVCAGWSLSYVPANTRIRVDGRTRRVTAVLPNGDVVPAARNLSALTPGAGIVWPDLGCESVVAAVRVGATHVDAATARSTLSIAWRDG